MTHIYFSSDSVSTADRAFNYGDGCFSTFAVCNSIPELFDKHINRLKADADNLDIVVDDWPGIEQHILDTASSMQDGVLKVLVSRGQGGRGYAPHKESESSVWITRHTIPAHYDDWRSDGITLAVSEIRMAHQPALAGIKHLNRLEQVLTKMSVTEPPSQEAVLCCSDGFMVECSASNLLWKTSGIWYTPDLSLCGVNGVMRDHVIEHLKIQQQPVFEINAVPSALLVADSVLVCNALMGIVPVRQFLFEGQQRDFCLSTVKSDIDRLVISMNEQGRSGDN